MICFDMVELYKFYGVYVIFFGISDDFLVRWDFGEVVGLIVIS